METFKKKWNGVAVEDCGTYMSKEAKSFVTAFRNMLKRELADLNPTITISPNHYDLSGMIEIGGKFLYVSYNIPRWGDRIDFSESGLNGVLYRPAKHAKDWRGGRNRFCSILKLPDQIRAIFKTDAPWAECEGNR